MTWFEDYFDGWTTYDADAVAAFFTDDVEFEDVGAGHHLTGKDRMRKFVNKSGRQHT